MDIELALGISIVKELGKGKRWVLPEYTIIMGEDYTIGFLLKKENGDELVGGLTDLTLKDIIRLAKLHGVDMILPSDPLSRITRHAENLTW